MGKVRFFIGVILIFINLISVLTSAITWERGSLHQHTGFSTWWGYDGDLLTLGDNCAAEWLAFNGGCLINGE